MDYARKAARIQVSLPPELLKEIDDFAKDNYCTRSLIVCLAVSQYIKYLEMYINGPADAPASADAPV